MEKIPISAFYPGEEIGVSRRLDTDHVKRLAASIAEIGLQVPISVTSADANVNGSYNGKTYSVVAGRHRLKACLSLGWTEIPVNVLDLTEIQSAIWQIDENLCRLELTQLERAEHLRARKNFYEAAHPETRPVTERGGPGRGKTAANSAAVLSAPSFVEDTARKSGMSERSVRESVHRAEAISPEVKEAIADMPEIADKGVELDALAAMEPEEQKRAVDAVREGKAKTVRGASTRPPSAPKPKPDPQYVGGTRVALESRPTQPAAAPIPMGDTINAVPLGKRGRILANAAKQKMVAVLSQGDGLRDCLPELSLDPIAKATPKSELKTWAAMAHGIGRAFIDFGKALDRAASEAN